MAIEIRVLGTDDTAILMNVAEDVFDDPIHLRSAETFLRDPHHHIVVALDNDLVVGFVSSVHYFHVDKARPSLWINEVSVAGTHRSQGIGSQLMQRMLEVARTHKCAEAWVLTDRNNIPAMRLYSACDGSDTDHVMFDFRLNR